MGTLSPDDPAGKSRDMPLAFRWRPLSGWDAGLGLPAPRNRRAADAQAFIIASAIKAAGRGQAVSYSRRRAWYVGRDRYDPAFTYAATVPTIDGLAAAGMLLNDVAPGRGPSGRQSVFRASPLLLDAAGSVTLRPVAPREIIELRDAAKHPTGYADTPETRRMRRGVEALNEALGAATITYPECVDPAEGTAMRRVFNADFRHGGRFYGGTWQTLPKALRSEILLNDEPVTELDYANLHPRLLYIAAGSELVGDAYDLPGWPRKLVKIALNVLLNALTYAAAVGAVSHKIDAPDAIPQARRLIADLKRRHAPIARYFHSGAGLILQRVDSDMAASVTGDLLKQGVVSLPVHDSFIVPERHREALSEVMETAFLTIGRKTGVFLGIQ